MNADIKSAGPFDSEEKDASLITVWPEFITGPALPATHC
jgi:hypothetical protein